MNIYATWNEANQASDFCSDRTSCVDIVALCFNDTANPSATFCRCPYGYKVVSDNKRCGTETRFFSRLALPVLFHRTRTDRKSSLLSIGYSAIQVRRMRYLQRRERCLYQCRWTNYLLVSCYVHQIRWPMWFVVDGPSSAFDFNSFCFSVQRPTPRETVIFPTQADRSIHDFTSKCATGSNATEQVQNSLCTCASGYQFVAAKQACGEIILGEFPRKISTSLILCRENSYGMERRGLGIRTLYSNYFSGHCRTWERSLSAAVAMPSTKR